ncbi:type II toxin-antitoxin system VapC family toxin [uncultured Jatrophihabitans sp.]|uniref:type II toxin-antitoxin system VapC family toxin n=1 Tax=uncultured Jatrophihabitans sp. TaxID=1610747 RepID=UPI0035CBEFD0
MTTAFDADALIYAAAPQHPLGARVRASLGDADVHVGSVLLLPEVLGKPLREGRPEELRALAGVLARLELRAVDRATADLAAEFAGRYRLRAADATHLASAVVSGADRFITNNRRDFPASIAELDVVYPPDLPPA